MAPKKFPPKKTATKGKRPPGVPAQVHPATTSDATSEVEASPAALHQEEETSFEGDATAATAATAATPADEEEEEEEEPLVMPDASHSPPHEEEEEEEEQQQQPAPKTKGKGKKKADAAPKQGWSLPDTTEQDLVEWLQSNTYLWLRSTKDYHRKKASWEMKAKEWDQPETHSRTGGKTSRTGMLSCPRDQWPGNQDVDGEGQVGVEEHRLLQKFHAH
ncbi:hypothetical protein GWK47_001020 [Chionoecetes opilio]|uniref:Uncharacterized protein n=1 Tax=Chionoecetes opilio TaxID=41210 RepID=A0A8J5CQQ0_CHIOP|nr:hypothetical protein GWK47_001020 [Chionoecetes opilio]